MGGARSFYPGPSRPQDNQQSGACQRELARCLLPAGVAAAVAEPPAAQRRSVRGWLGLAVRVAATLSKKQPVLVSSQLFCRRPGPPRPGRPGLPSSRLVISSPALYRDVEVQSLSSPGVSPV